MVAAPGLRVFVALSVMGLVGLGCAAADSRAFPPPPGGGIAKGEPLVAPSVESTGEAEPAEEDAPPPEQADPQAAPVRHLPKRLPGTNPVPDRAATRTSSGAKYSSVQATIYGADWCGLCHAAEKFLRSKGVRVSVKNIEKDRRAWSELRGKLGQAGRASSNKIPVIDINGQIMVGYSRSAIEQALENTRSSRSY